MGACVPRSSWAALPAHRLSVAQLDWGQGGMQLASQASSLLIKGLVVWRAQLCVPPRLDLWPSGSVPVSAVENHWPRGLIKDLYQSSV